jgi:adenosylhomocysteine nucleosidase
MAMCTERESVHTAFVVAVSEEKRALLRHIRQVGRRTVNGVDIWLGSLSRRPVALACSGMGAERSYRTTQVLLSAVRPSQLLVLGFCGGISEWAGPSNVVVSEYVMDWPDFPGVSDLDQPRMVYQPSQSLLDAARQLAERDDPDTPPVFRFRTTVGGVLSVDRLVQTTTIKGYHGPRAARCRAIDMESAGAARAAEEAGVPWLAVRGVTDTLDEDLPMPFEQYMGADGELNRARILAAAVRRPALIPALVRLGAESMKAARNLAEFAQRLVEAT